MTHRAVPRWLVLFGAIAFAGLSALAAWHPTAFRLDIAALSVAMVAGVVPAVLAAVAGIVAVVARSHDHWRDIVPFAIALVAAVGVARLVRWPQRPNSLPSRTTARLLLLAVGAALLGLVQHHLEHTQLQWHTGHVAFTALGILCGALIGVTVLWWPRRGVELGPVFLSGLVSAITVSLVLLTIGFWSRQDEQLLHVTADATSQGFLTSLADQMNVITNKADTSSVEPFTIARFPTLMQPVVFGHDALPASQLVQLGTNGVAVVAGLSSLGGEFERVFQQWTESAAPEIRNAASSGVLTYLGLAALPEPTGGHSPYLIYATTLLPAPGQATAPDQILVMALSIPVMVKAAAAPTLAGTGEAVLSLFQKSGEENLLLWNTTNDSGADDTSLGGVFVPSPMPTDTNGSTAVATMALNDTEFTFAAQPGRRFGTPIGFRRLMVSLEVLGGLLIVGLLLVNGDHRTRRERERLRREALLAAALEGAPGWTAIIDLDGRVVMANRNELGTGAGAALRDVPLWQDDPEALDAVTALLGEARRGAPNGMQHVWSHPDDPSHAMRIFEIEARPLPDPSLVYLQCVDVTEHRDRAMRTAQSERMEAIGVLAGGLAHDFNNLLFITLGYLQMVERLPQVSNDQQLHLYVSRAIEAVERGAVVAKSLLSVARSQPLTAVPLNLRQFLDDLQPLIEQALGTAHRLELNAVGDTLDVVVDPGRLSSSVLNAVFNARDAIDGQGTVEIRVEHCISAPVDGEPQSVIGVSIRDNGRGMPPEVVARAFEPFFTTKQVGSGTGLGLSTVYSFAQQSGGWAAIESAEGVGTTVTIFLPPALEATQDGAPTVVPRRATRALVVDDEPALADLVAGWLEDLGMNTRVANTPEAALATAESFHPELLMSDANLGASIDGLELARILVERDPALLVVFMTGFSERIRALQAAGVATLAKPFSRDDLLASLSTHLGTRLSDRSAGGAS